MLIDLMRHGVPEGGRRYRGQADDPLSDAGWTQMWQAVGEYAEWQSIVTSPLVRCAAFADALSEKRGIPVVRDDRLMECGFGEWEGKLPSEICAQDANRLFRFKCDPVGNAPPGAEALSRFHARVGACWQDLLQHQKAGHVLVVTHAGVIRMMLSHALALDPRYAYRLAVSNAALTRIRVECEDGVRLPTLLFHDGRLQEKS